jgi:two-component system, cell cycle sensor histidine kinase and response regulator CckA
VAGDGPRDVDAFEALFRLAPQPMWVVDAATLRFLEVNDAMVARYGWTRDELLAMNLRDIRPPDLVAELEGVLAGERSGPARHAHSLHRRKDGTTLHVQIDVQPIAWRGRPARLVLATEVSETVRTPEALGESEARYRLLFDANLLPMWVFDVETLAFLAVNAAALDHYGWTREEFLAMTIKDIRPPEDVPRLLAAHAAPRAGRRRAGLFRHRTRSGELIDVEIVSHEITWAGRGARLVLAHDVTDRLRAERALAHSQQRLRQAQKLEAVGALAGGVAHDFNNLTTVIRTLTDLLLDDPELRPQQRTDLEDVRHAASRATELTRKLLAVSRKQTLQPRVLDLNAVVADGEKMLRRVLREDIALETALARPLPRVFADPSQLEEALLNLAVNARDAMPSGGTLLLRTAEVEIGPDLAARNPGARAGAHVVLSVSDTGVGMSAEVQARCFEPFFTTKPEGEGTGLGLATVHGALQQSGGFVRLASAPGHGTTVSLFLPRHADAEAPAAPGAVGAGPPRGGTETILVVEDEPGVRAAARRVLEAHGYLVASAGNGREALAVAEGLGAALDLVLTDVVMPEVGGRELVTHLRASWPRLRVLFTSGYPRAELCEGTLPGDVTFLQKPFTTDQLARAAREALDAAAPPPL